MVTLCFIVPPQSAPELCRCQYGMAANVVGLSTCDVPNMCLSLDLGSTGSTACDVQDVM